MEVFIAQCPAQATDASLERFFKPHLSKLGIYNYSCQKITKNRALLTILDRAKAEVFMKEHGRKRDERPTGQRFQNGQKFRNGQTMAGPKPKPLTYLNTRLDMFENNRKPDEFVIRHLQRDAEAKAIGHATGAVVVNKEPGINREFPFVSVACGLWDYAGNSAQSVLVFAQHTKEAKVGVATFRERAVTLKFESSASSALTKHVEIPYSWVEVINIARQGEPQPAITFTLSSAPRIYEDISPLDLALRGLAISPGTRKESFTRKRILSAWKSHNQFVGQCFVYRIDLMHDWHLQNAANLKRAREIPRIVDWWTSVVDSNLFTRDMTALSYTLAKVYTEFPFGLKFQMQRLAQNGILPPGMVSKLLNDAYHLLKRSGPDIAIRSVRKLAVQIPLRGPDTSADKVSYQGLKMLLAECERVAKREALEERPKYHVELGLVYRALVTPTGCYLWGPCHEPRNRILRKYAAFTDNFLRVQFADEDGEPIRFDRQASNEEIFHGRFKNVLSGIINIAGNGYEFLGFSHSSLRSQTCWFMAPFILNGTVTHAGLVIKQLGDFSKIHSPAKCAARIGQAFSETSSSVTVARENQTVLLDVQRGERVFSDGVGTLSMALLEKVWQAYSPARIRTLKPTLLQIRYAGAKGMLSLDSRLEGESLCLRESMIKFEGSQDTNIEICGAAFKPLPMVLNRQLIKILEDLGVPPKIFEDLQAEAVNRLRVITKSATNAASFLDRNFIGQAAHIPGVIRKLRSIGIPFQADSFLNDVVEMGVLMQLRELKYRSRIPVEKGYTLYGIMDETNYLKEGEIYIAVESEKTSREVVIGTVVVTRAPALHPGDIRMAEAVDVPESSPLRNLHNCVVFSQNGQRDLPSQLSGGDLDGDLYQIITHEGLYPEFQHPPADYPRATAIDIGREVMRKDMTDFFIQFMENDQLGRIATLHQILADQMPDGTRNSDCMRLAEMHSTAVDFSKTGIPVDMKQLPRYSHIRPDFLATGPRVRIAKGVQFEDVMEQESKLWIPEDEEQAGYKYYESRKTLGKLFRAIDEREFLRSLKEFSKKAIDEDRPDSVSISPSVMNRVWEYVQRETRLIEWSHHVEWARDIKETYEDTLLDIMHNYSRSNKKFPLQEVEVFVGSIIGKNGALSKRQRDRDLEMKDTFERAVSFTIACISKTPVEDGEDAEAKYGPMNAYTENGEQVDEALERSIACLSVAQPGEATREGYKHLRSFAWVAAGVCFRELERFQWEMRGKGGGFVGVKGGGPEVIRKRAGPGPKPGGVGSGITNGTNLSDLTGASNGWSGGGLEEESG